MATARGVAAAPEGARDDEHFPRLRRITLLAAQATPLLALAHHGRSGYDNNTPLKVAGTIREAGHGAVLSTFALVWIELSSLGEVLPSHQARCALPVGGRARSRCDRRPRLCQCHSRGTSKPGCRG